MKKGLLIILCLLMTSQATAWGLAGHRIIGLIAERHLTKKAHKNIEKVLGNLTLAEASNYMDFVKSDATYRYMSPWHYATIPDDKTYEEAGTPEEGDVIVAIQQFIDQLSSDELDAAQQAFALKCLVHLIGDIHQPLHVGNGDDRGGNDKEVYYFGKKSNLHRVWDSDLIEGQGYSYTEYADWIDHPTEEELSKWSNRDVLGWALESKELRVRCYDTLPENTRISYRYVYDNIDLLNVRLLQAGLRLAHVLNELYG